MAYKHGIYTDEVSTLITTTTESPAAPQVIIGTAPVNQLDDPSAAVNTPIVAYTYKEAVAAVGYSDDFESYTLCEAIMANFSVVGVSPIVLINVLDPSTHRTSITTTSVDITDGVALVEEEGILLDNLTVKANGTTLAEDTDFTASFDDDGYLEIIILDDGSAASATSLTLSGYKVDPSAVTASDIVGGVESDGTKTGIEVVSKVFPKYGIVPGILLAPRWSKDAEVAAALQAKCTGINGCFRAVCYIDVDSSSDGVTLYSDVDSQKDEQGITSEYAYAIWGYAKVDDVIYSGSSLAGALTAHTDANSSNIPYVSPSNKTIEITAPCLEDGTELYLDQEEANVVNSYGVATWLNWAGEFVLWGNETAAGPDTDDPKDMFLAARRFMNWAGNTFIVIYSPKVDNPTNPRLIQTIIDAENLRGNSFVSSGICARYELTYDPADNTEVELAAGKLYFHQYVASFLPAKEINNTLEFDVSAIKTALSEALA